ncbi:RDD family protein [Taibaiella soli]|uniref:RDD domain-containing protein n=1 Tax=Taibaiella soli TaxID=1649169 RepID=A0A2W2A9K7_9BACT|nr:RDD family protein [Taibaiella soli]PZF71951.1 hypothetical protein DN068_15695 [Taibaiella soli]
MSTLVVTTPFNIDLEFKIAPFMKRVWATLLDMLVVSVYAFVVFEFILIPLDVPETMGQTLAILLVSIPAFLYHLLMEIFFNGQSVGKKLVGIKVMDKEGNEPTLSQYLVRWILGLSNYAMMTVPYIIFLVIISGGAYIFALFSLLTIYLPDVISVAATGKSQRLGDLAGGTVVIDAKAETSINETIYLEIEETNYEAKYPEVMRLSDRDINGIRNLLALKSARETDQYMIEVSYRIKDVLGIQSDLPPNEFLHQLLHDYNYLTQK